MLLLFWDLAAQLRSFLFLLLLAEEEREVEQPVEVMRVHGGGGAPSTRLRIEIAATLVGPNMIAERVISIAITASQR